jgi:hypothetical protein
LREYSDHSNYGYDNHTNYSESYTKAYFYQAYYGAGSHTDYTVFYNEFPDPPTYKYEEESGYYELYGIEYSKTTTSYDKSGYDNHSNSGYGVYNNHSNNGYYYNQGA